MPNSATPKEEESIEEVKDTNQDGIPGQHEVSTLAH
jgi:hypothetical protein